MHEDSDPFSIRLSRIGGKVFTVSGSRVWMPCQKIVSDGADVISTVTDDFLPN